MGMTRFIVRACALGMILGALSSHGRETEKRGEWTIAPFWKSATMEGESVLFVRERDGDPPQASLLFPPTRILSVKSASGLVVYEAGRDYAWSPGERTIALPAGSRIPFKTRAELYPPKGAPQSIEGRRGESGSLFFSEGHVFHDLQAAVTYTHDERWNGYVPKFAGEMLPHSIGKLKVRLPFTLALFGDSISEGYNASGFTGAPPFQPPYGTLLVLALEAEYRTTVRFVNHSLAGKTTEWGLENIGNIIADSPDLVVIAFGMNDASAGMAPETFAGNVRRMINEVRKSRPECEFILVAAMTGNPEWTYSSPDLYPAYRDALADICGKGVVLADLTSVWTNFLRRKRFLDFTGNGVNHPNDFGHRLYAEVLMGLLIE